MDVNLSDMFCFRFQTLEDSENPLITLMSQEGPLGGGLLFVTSSLAVGYSALPPHWIYWYLLIISFSNPLFVYIYISYI